MFKVNIILGICCVFFSLVFHFNKKYQDIYNFILNLVQKSSNSYYYSNKLMRMIKDYILREIFFSSKNEEESFYDFSFTGLLCLKINNQ
jgi:hypothetical protein